MDYYIGKHLSEARQREAIRSDGHRQLAKTALSCCIEDATNLIGRIKLALQIRSAHLCCFDIE